MGHLREREGVKKGNISAVTLYSQLQVTTQKNVIHRPLRTLNNAVTQQGALITQVVSMTLTMTQIKYLALLLILLIACS